MASFPVNAGLSVGVIARRLRWNIEGTPPPSAIALLSAMKKYLVHHDPWL